MNFFSKMYRKLNFKFFKFEISKPVVGGRQGTQVLRNLPPNMVAQIFLKASF